MYPNVYMDISLAIPFITTQIPAMIHDGVLVPDHVPDLDCPAPWHAGHAYTVGYMKGLPQYKDGANAARFLSELADLIEEPAGLAD